MENEQQLGDMFKPTVITARSEKTGNSLQLSVWGGRLGLTVYPKQGQGNLFKKSINRPQLLVVDTALDTLIGQPPESHQNLTILAWDNEQRKMVPDFQMNLLKDERQVYMIELKGRGNNGGAFEDRFSFLMRSDIILNAEPFKPAESSSYAVKDLRQYLKFTCPNEMSITGRRFVPNGQSKGKGGNGYSQNFKGEGPKSKIETNNDIKGFDDPNGLEIPF